MELIFISYVAYYILALVGITIGYHRYFAHGQFKTNKIIEFIFLYVGLLCGARSALSWASLHRMHHHYSDTPKDPYYPKQFKWYITLFSLYKHKNIPIKFCRDLYKNKLLVHFHKWGYVYLFLTYGLALFIDYKLLLVLLLVFLFSYIGFGLFNLLTHNKDGPVNNTLINVFAPFEGNHKKHHDYF